MQIINEAASALDDAMQGIIMSYPHLRQVPGTRAVYDWRFKDDTVPLIGGGGSGHDPAHWGYVGDGMLTAAVMGPMFIPPTAADIVATVKTVTKQKRAFFIVKNFKADVASFGAAATTLRAEGYDIGTCVVADDISVDTGSLIPRRRGVAGTILVHKILGAAARHGADIPELRMLAAKLAPEIKTIGFSFSGAQMPGHDDYSFDLPANAVAYGVGIHGEPGYRVEPYTSSELLARELLGKIRQSFRWQAGDQLAVFINSLGGTAVMEQMIFASDVQQLLALEPVAVPWRKVGTFLTSSGMHGLSLSILRLSDPEWLEALREDVDVASWVN
ncbi:DhaKLM operon coactivator DhaQ [Lacticaseibacillus songhuajiangensis]|uniref:DhaKLM operon coactivator DhaQ n=1 Tax=Lacticaseibacillus songhuajiangensis TaxID=1296539 RepID=UPI000F79ABED|nr:DhaKLM operon coactivator DhaQ [Lacticaseibacillus songhuajiangensis]